MNLSMLRTRTRKLVQETTAGVWTDADIDAAINNRYFEAQGRINYIRPGYFDTGALYDLVANTASYPRPFFRPVRGYYRKNGSDYVECRVYSFETTTLTAEHDLSHIVPPTVYAVVEIGTRIYVYPTPSANETAGLKVISDFDVSLSVDTDAPRLKSELHWRLPRGAAAELLADDPTYPQEAVSRLESDWLYIFAPEPAAAKRLARIYPERRLGQLRLDPQAPIASGRTRYWSNGGQVILWS